MSYKGLCAIHGPHYEEWCPVCGPPENPQPRDSTPEERAALDRIATATQALQEADTAFSDRRADQLSRELGIEDVADAFAGVEREQLETELYKVGCALIAAVEEYGIDGELGISAAGFKGAAGRVIAFHIVGDRIYVQAP